MKIGVLSLQGSFREHLQALQQLGIEGVTVLFPEQLKGIQGLIIPGGESTAITRLAHFMKLFSTIKTLGQSGLPIWGTCAGMVLLSRGINGNNHQKTLQLIDITIERNAYGRQRESFEAMLNIQGIQGPPFWGIFIRAPMVLNWGTDVEVLSYHEGKPVACRQGMVWVTSFHPELTEDLRFHKLFLDSIL